MSYPRAFTLIELLVVISIIALLIAILLPALSSAQYSAKSLDCMTRIRQLGMAYLLYAQDNDDFCAVHRLTDETGTPFGSNRGVSIDEQLSGYDGSTDFSYEESINRQWGDNVKDVPIWQCPLEDLDRAADIPRRSYLVSGGFSKESRAIPNNWRDSWGGLVMGDASWSGGYANLNQPRVSEVPSPANTVAMSDAATQWSYLGYADANVFNLRVAMVVSRGYYQGFGHPGWPSGPSFFYAHERSLGADPKPNMVFLDGHAESIDVVSILKEKGYDPPYTTYLSERGTIFDPWYK